MENLEKAFIRYLKNNDVNDAFFITGVWGSGKTYYIKNRFSEIIKEQDFFVLYISLNGIESREQLGKIIFTKFILGIKPKSKTTIFDTFKSKTSKIIGSIKKYDFLFNVIDYSDFIELDDIVIVFDDLERISDNFNIVDFLGYINSELIEHKGYKVVFVGDDTKNQLNKKMFFESKEKLIGWTIRFKTDIRKVIGGIIEKSDKSTKSYKIINKNKDFIIRLYEEFEYHNIRTVKFFLKCSEYILNSLSCDILLIEKDLIYFIFLTCEEFRSGRISPMLDNKIVPEFITNNSSLHFGFKIEMDTFEVDTSNNPSDEDDETEKKYTELFQRNYKERQLSILKENRINYTYFNSVFQFIITGILDEKELNSSCKELSDFRKGRENSEEFSLINELSTFWLLTNNEFKEKEEVLKNKISQGKLSLYEYTYACKVVFELYKNGMIDFDLESLEKFLITNLSKIDFNDESTIPKHSTTFIESFDEDYQKIYKAMVDKIDEGIKVDRQKEANKVFSDWRNHLDSENMDLILQNVEASKVVSYILELLKGDRKILSHFFKEFMLSCKNFGFKSQNILMIKEGLEKELNELSLVDKHWVRKFIFRIEEYCP